MMTRRNIVSKVLPALKQLRTLLLLLMMTAGASGAWGQSEGYYYIANNSSYNSGNPAVNWYLVPADNPQQTDYQDAYYSDDSYATPGDPEKPFLTTYKTNRDAATVPSGVTERANNSVWALVPVPDESGFFYIVHASTGKYVVYEPPHSTATNRKSMHLQTTDNPEENAKFAITTKSSGYNIRPKSLTSGNRFFNPAGSNQAFYYGQTATSNPKCYGGLVGVYSGDTGTSIWLTESANSIYTAFPTITDNGGGSFTITATEGDVYYTTDGTTPTTSLTSHSSPCSVTLTVNDDVEVIKAIAKDADKEASIVITYWLPKCRKPNISVSSGTVTITPKESGESVFYSTEDDGSVPSTLYSGPFSLGDASTIRAIAKRAGYAKSEEAIYMDFKTVSSSSDITNMQGLYRLADGFSSTAAIGTSAEPFRGIIDGQLYTISNLDHPLVAYADGATIKNVILDNVTISSGTNVGAICNEATGASRIYNCGILSGTVSGSGNVGSLVGLLDGSARVINCYSYADINGGDYRGGIVGKNNVASTSSNLQTMVMNCMFYGNISTTGSFTQIAPVYGDSIIHNKYADVNNTGLNNYCYFLYDETNRPYVTSITTYNGTLGAEERFLNRFEFFRLTLNSTRALAAFYVSDDATDKDQIAKWVLDKTVADYPILKTPGYYPSIINPDAANATTIDPDSETDRNKGGKLGLLTVNIRMGSGGPQFSAPTGASITTTSLTLNVTDKDYANYNFNYKKVQLPYYSEVGEGNYTGSRVVTGWKIVAINGSSTGTGANFTTGSDVVFNDDGTIQSTPYNFVDRTSTKKDLYSVSGRVFSQGAYWEVPDGVSSITIEPYWAKAVYLSDTNYDVTYSGTTKYGVTVTGTCPTSTNSQTVYNDMGTAISNLGSNSSHTVYDYAVVLVGNYHHYTNNAPANNSNPLTIMSADLDGDCEPDNTLLYYHNARKNVSPIRFDFLNMPGIGMVKRTHDATTDPEPGIFKPNGWFEITNTVLVRFGQFEYADAGGNGYTAKTILAPLILQGGIYEQFVSAMGSDSQNTNYLFVGGNAWFKNFANGCHTNKFRKTPKVPINVTGGDYTNFYLTGIYQPNGAEDDGNAECYIDGGRFSEVAGAGMQVVNGDVTWLINGADIANFYGGGINAAQPITGNITTVISNSYVDEFHGGPKFGDMTSGMEVTTTASDCHFGRFYGAGYGGTAFNRVNPGIDDSNESDTRDWDSWVTKNYKREHNSGNKGISTSYDYEFILHSDGSRTVARFFVNYASLSLASTRDVKTRLKGCTIGTFFGGGRLGAVNGNINSTLTGCTVTGNAYGAGFSAEVPTVEVWPIAYLDPNPTYNRQANVFNNSSVQFPTPVVYKWDNGHDLSTSNCFYDSGDEHYIYTNVSLSGLGVVSGNATLTLDGDSEVGGSVYGGGDESSVTGNTIVTLQGNTVVAGNVFGGGNEGEVGGSATVNIEN